MKTINSKFIYLLASVLILTVGCNKITDLKPLDTLSDAAYWTKPSDFKTFANQYYGYLHNFGNSFADNAHYDGRADVFGGGGAYGAGTNTVPATDGNWTNNYNNIRACNYLLEKAADYSDKAGIAQYVAEAKFFRAYCYFELLEIYGGVPLITKTLDLNSPELMGTRATRDEVADQIIADLQAAIPDLPASILASSADFGRVSRTAAQAFLGRVALYEATWQKFRSGNATRYNALFDISSAASAAVIASNQYALFGTAASNALGGNSTILGDSCQKYLFILENPKSNPAGVTKSANHEYILSYRYDDVIKTIGTNISRQGTQIGPQHKYVNAFLCQDGLPIEKSPLFQGFQTYGSEFANRDNRLKYTIKIMNMYYWYGNINFRITWVNDAADNANAYGPKVTQIGGYSNQKWVTERNCPDTKESEDYPVIRYAEVLLNYAEAVYERTETITDVDLNKSINLVRLRVNKTMPPLTNAFVAANGLDFRTEIRRERFIELYYEGFRFDDIKRWHSAATDLVTNVGGTAYGNASAFVSPWPVGIKYVGTQAQIGPNALVPAPTNAKDANGALILDNTGRLFSEKNYLYPIPTQQITLNPNLVQNPGWQ
ncbi:RagB/SusD family nutrient uptake outer membrane protein [Mucilaginibacter sp. HMF5004]|uniref:RagB/SusD family nutrient uptake outer membrane protein n=1 Tax=Mucilaginibacter rivuli TaxID=2857527 RepID=UPI001C5FB79F|nr:RagB/SusD family nutrient uptake outer membrane protein [Mucilaginibacter rivuli]MBW4889755.1 RagB/SusD family nutrient uptake outer membrane protein [Mucilaginibacter rivuli]